MKVILYYDEGCFDCVIAKTYLEAMKIDFEAKNLKDDNNKLELIEKVHKYIAPVIIIDDDVYLGFGSIDGKFISNAPEILERLGILPAVKDEQENVINVLPKIIKTLGIVE
ncbi:hypothetical protein ES703_36850 [subsurface metagenome]|uniref:Glutaredoxin domain-containing protein n=1 Tax=marine sediment metagenome TaxID=412755 RepID=X0ZRS8_9ZZZZ